MTEAMVDSQERLLDCKVGDRVPTTFGKAPALMFCVERVTTPTLFLRFRVLVFNVEVAEVSIERLGDGTIICEEL